MKKLLSSIILLLFLALIASSPAYASANTPGLNDSPVAAPYIDPTAGGVLIQILLVGTAGVLGLLKLFWRRIFTRWSRKKEGTPVSAKSDTDADA